MDSLAKAALAVLNRPMGLLYSMGLTATCEATSMLIVGQQAGCRRDMTQGMRSMARLAWPKMVLAHGHAGLCIQLALQACNCLSQLGQPLVSEPPQRLKMLLHCHCRILFLCPRHLCNRLHQQIVCMHTRLFPSLADLCFLLFSNNFELRSHDGVLRL